LRDSLLNLKLSERGLLTKAEGSKHEAIHFLNIFTT